VYTGQGIDHAASGEIVFVLRMAGLSPIELSEGDVRSGNFRGVAAVVFGDGSAAEIVNGWNLKAATRAPPWQPSVPSEGISPDGVAALGRFVRDGGRVVTIGRSAGVVVPSLADIRLLPDRPGIGQVQLDVTQAGRPLFAGVPAPEGRVTAFLAATPDGTIGSYLFKTARPEQVVAWYAGALDRPAEQSFADTTPLARTAGNAAIVMADAGKGRVVVFGFSPVFRAQWRATFPLLFNAIGAR
jgi:hypothetical protein